MPVAFDPASVRMDSVGDDYDVAIGYPDPNTSLVRMVGYVLTPGGTWSESTDMQDENHLVQIASPSSSDKFTRFPKVSQGDWSGGERQLIFITANQYYSSTQLNVSLPGHLTCNGAYYTATIPNGVTPSTTSPIPRVVASSIKRIYFLGVNAGTYYVSTYDLLRGTVGTAAATGFGILHEVMRNSDYPVYIGAVSGIWAGSGTGTTVTLTPQVTNDDVALINGASMATFAGSVYYIVGITSPNAIHAATYPLPGAGIGSTVYTAQQMEGLIQVLSRGSTGLIFVTGASSGVDQYVYAFDGVNANFLGRIEGDVLDACEANGTVYILTAALASQPSAPSLPVIYSVTGSTLNTFDDFRKVDPDFYPLSEFANGHIESDGAYLYLWYCGLSVKRYSLTTSAVSDIGNPACVTANSLNRAGTPFGDGGFVEIEPFVSTTTAYLNTPTLAPSVDGVMLTSWYDFGTPDVDKSFKSIEFAFNSTFVETSVTVNYQLDNPNTGFQPLDVDVSQDGLQLEALFPGGTIGKRVRYQITLSHLQSPDVQLWSTLATLARIWTFTVSCRHDPKIRGLTDDPQGRTSMQLIANILNAYQLAGGKVVMWVPDATVGPDNPSIDPITGANVIGVSQVSAVLQDYSRTNAPGVSPTYHQLNDGPADMSADILITAAEALG